MYTHFYIKINSSKVNIQHELSKRCQLLGTSRGRVHGKCTFIINNVRFGKHSTLFEIRFAPASVDFRFRWRDFKKFNVSGFNGSAPEPPGVVGVPDVQQILKCLNILSQVVCKDLVKFSHEIGPCMVSLLALQRFGVGIQVDLLEMLLQSTC